MKKQILLVEPDRLLSNTYELALEDAGYKVISANTAQAAILASDKNRPDLVILEVQLVEHSGIEFLYEFRSYEEWQNIPVIINTMVSPSEFKDNYKILKDELGVSLYLYKPQSSLRELLSSIKEVDLQPV